MKRICSSWLLQSIGGRWLARLAVVFVLANSFTPVTSAGSSLTNTGSDITIAQYFRQTGHNVAGLFLQNFEATGGVAINGLPLTEKFKDSTGLTIQVFERAILELHQPLENETGPQPQPYIEHKLLGDLLTAGRNFPQATPLSARSQNYFAATGHNIANRFVNFWQQNGGLPEFGYPISEEFQEVNASDGKTYTVQYFERARFEYHPELAGTQYTVELGLLGQQYAGSNYDRSLFKPVKAELLGPQKAVKVPSLMYHHIRELTQPLNSELNNYSVTPEAFSQQLDWLQANGYHSVTLGQVADYLKYGVPLPSKPVNIRFDDGWANQLWAANELKKRGMTATFFIISQARSYPYMTPDQLKQLDTEGFEIASHTRNHPFLTRNSAEYDWNQIAGSKADLEKLLGHPVRSFAYPFGDHNPQVDAMVQKAGYDIGVGIGWSENWQASTLFDEPTVSMSQMHTMSAFLARININY